MSRIALIGPPVIPIPPTRYAGTERVVEALGAGLHARGHHVTLFAPGDSRVDYELVPTVVRSLWRHGEATDPAAVDEALGQTVELVRRHAEQFDVIHSHVDAAGLPLTEGLPVPVVTTFHNRLDLGDTPRLLRRYRGAPLIAISESQRRFFPHSQWIATIPHGVWSPDLAPIRRASTDLVLIGRADSEKGVAEAIELARRSGRRLRLAAKVYTDEERAFVHRYIEPAVRDGIVDFAGEVDADTRDGMIVDAAATVMLGAWPEPFGLVAVESLVLGTPVIARRAGALPEIVQHGVDGFLIDDLDEAAYAIDCLDALDREEIRRRARTRFSVDLMVRRHETAYARAIGEFVMRNRGPSGGLRRLALGESAVQLPVNAKARPNGPLEPAIGPPLHSIGRRPERTP